MIPRILLLYALCSGSDRPTPRGPGFGVDISDASWVVVKELKETTEEALLLREVEGIVSWGANQTRFIDTRTRAKLKWEVWGYHDKDATYLSPALQQSSVRCIGQDKYAEYVCRSLWN